MIEFGLGWIISNRGNEVNMFVEIHQGYSRIVVLVGDIGIKFPNMLHGDRAVVLGMQGNIHEYEIYRSAYPRESETKDNRLAKVYFRLPFGLALVVKRYHNIIHSQDQLPDKNTISKFITNVDLKTGNFAIENGQIVVLDYGNPGAWYIG